MATTTNFGWETPDDTDLVKDGALAMRTLGNAIDASLVDLKGGTTGQVLSKTSNTDMDFTWVTSDDANAIQNAIVDAKGDLITATANDTPARLAVGNNGETLVADSSTSTGLRWSPAPSAGNPVINSAFQVWQRGTSFSVSGFSAYTADRWIFASGQNSGRTVSRQLTNDTTNLPNIQYCVRVQRNSGNSATSGEYIGQTFESVNSIPYAGKTVTVSFYARAGANYSATSNALNFVFATGTGTDQNGVTSSFTGNTNAINTSVTLTTTWQRFTATATLLTNISEMAFYVYGTTTGTAGANDYYEITGVQIDLGSVALPFRTYSATLAGELAACRRYYKRTTSTSQFQIVAQLGMATGTTGGIFAIDSTPMRVKPTSIDYANVAFYDYFNPTVAITNLIVNAYSSDNVQIVEATVASGLTQYRPYFMITTSTGGYVGLSAEL